MNLSSSPSQVTIIKHNHPINGNIRVPGSKSLTNRALILASLSSGKSKLNHVLLSDDTKVMIDALLQMDVDISFSSPTTIDINSTGKLSEPQKTLYLGNAGTATRFLTAVSCLVNGNVRIDGDIYMQSRPIMPLVNALRHLGIEIVCETGCPPLTIKGNGRFNGDEVIIDGNLSSQYVSALLMLAPFCKNEFSIVMQDSGIGGQGYIDLTLALMNKFGIEVSVTDNGWKVRSQSYVATEYDVEPDASSMTYIWAIESLTNGNIDTSCDPKKMTQPDAVVYDLIQSFPNFPDVIDGSQFQDAVPTLAVMSAFSNKKVRFTGIENLRVKECDRTAALKEGLCKIHPQLAKEIGDDLVVDGCVNIEDMKNLDILIDSKDDHRMAMCFSLAGLMLEGISISNPNCVAKTYPSYWETLQKLGIELKFQ